MFINVLLLLNQINVTGSELERKVTLFNYSKLNSVKVVSKAKQGNRI